MENKKSAFTITALRFWKITQNWSTKKKKVKTKNFIRIMPITVKSTLKPIKEKVEESVNTPMAYSTRVTGETIIFMVKEDS